MSRSSSPTACSCRKPILDAPRLGCFNGHASLLPRWRGAAPIQRAIMAGDSETGMMVMKMDEGLDTGPVALTERVADRPRHDGRRAARRADGGRRRADGARRWRRSKPATLPLDAAAGRGRHLCRQDRQGRDAHRLVAAGARRSTTTSAACRPFPAPGSKPTIGGKPERLKVLRSTLAEGAGAPGTVLDDALTVACGDGRRAPRRGAARRRQAGRGDEFLRGAKLGRKPPA